MTGRYLHMLSWGLLYAGFSLLIVLLYRSMYYKEKPICITVGRRRKGLIRVSDIVVYSIITFVSAIRLNTGSDFYNYYIYFNQIKERYANIREVLFQSQGGYWILSYIIKMFTDYQYAIFVVVAVFSYAHLFYLMRNEVTDCPSALVCYFFLGYYANSINIIKQYIAMAFVMSAYLCFRRKKIVRCVAFCLLAIIFHYSAALILVTLFAVHRIEPSISKFWMSVVAGIGGAIALNYIFIVFFWLVPSASGYEKYINWRRSGQFRLIAAVVGMSLVYGLLIYVITKNKDSIRKVDENRYKEIIFLIVGLGINIISIRQWIINRIAIYFYQFIILILPAMFQGMDTKRAKRLKMILYSVMFLYMIFSSIFLGENEYFSYNTVFSGDPPISDVQYNIMHGWTK